MHAPAIANLTIFPPRAALNEGGGTVTVNGSVDFSDGGGDIAEVRLLVHDSAGTLIDNLVMPVQAPGLCQGTLAGTFAVGTTAADVYVIKVNVGDNGGNLSNTVSGMFVIHLPRLTTVPPAVLEPGLTVSPVPATGGLSPDGARAGAVSIGPTGDIYVGDSQFGRIFKLNPLNGSKTLHASGLPSGMPMDICWTPSGRMFATSNGTPGGNLWELTTGSPVLLSTLPGMPTGVRGGSGDTLFVADRSTFIWKVSPAGSATPFLTGLQGPTSLALDNAGYLYYSTLLPQGTSVSRTSTGGAPSPTMFVPLLPASDSIVVDGAGNLYASDRFSASIYKVSGGRVFLFASGFTGDSVWGGPAGLAIDNTGALYVADMNSLWKITTP